MATAWCVLSIACAAETDAAAGPAVQIDAVGCGPATIRGSGTIVDDDLVLVAAHVVAGADEISVTAIDREGLTAEIVALDTRDDLALLAVDDLGGEALVFADPEVGTEAVGTGFGGDDAGATIDYTITATPTVSMRDIYNDRRGERRGVEIDGPVDAGDSGAGLFDASGRMVAMVFAQSRPSPSVAYGTAAWELEAFIDGSASAAEAEPVPCAGAS